MLKYSAIIVNKTFGAHSNDSEENKTDFMYNTASTKNRLLKNKSKATQSAAYFA